MNSRQRSCLQGSLCWMLSQVHQGFCFSDMYPEICCLHFLHDRSAEIHTHAVHALIRPVKQSTHASTTYLIQCVRWMLKVHTWKCNLWLYSLSLFRWKGQGMQQKRRGLSATPTSKLRCWPVASTGLSFVPHSVALRNCSESVVERESTHVAQESSDACILTFLKWHLLFLQRKKNTENHRICIWEGASWAT